MKLFRYISVRCEHTEGNCLDGKSVDSIIQVQNVIRILFPCESRHRFFVIDCLGLIVNRFFCLLRFPIL